MNTKDAVKVERMHILDGDGSTKAFCDIVLFDAFKVKGLRVVQGKEGIFVSMPREQGKDGKWYDTFTPVSKDVKQNIQEIILESYNKK